MAPVRRSPFVIAGNPVRPGKKAKHELPIARLMSGTPVALPVLVVHGRYDGPTIWLSAAVHGDELCGVEIIRQTLDGLDPRLMHGTVLAVPVVNVHGFNTGDRYLPDRRDLNRSFPGSPRGSLASRIAHLLMTEIVARSSVGIDFHTGSDRRTNLPQIRGDLDDPDTLALARTFGAPIAIHSRLRDGSLRQAATEAGATVLLYEGGEASRFDAEAIAAGRDGTHRILTKLGIVPNGDPGPGETLLSRHSRWVRAHRSGILHLDAGLGARVSQGDIVATIVDPFGKRLSRLTARSDGVIIGHTQHALVNQGDAVAHIAEIDST
ncbi:MAG: succinylglutamate desuccinylase/aspartoacylase family protein [Acidimicrobiia bacterium]|nr:succinylglutamate desuccinylase/aspartoacylase family protein [Acidimicrobiia bacterium]